MNSAYGSPDDKHFRRLTELCEWNFIRQRYDRQIHKTLLEYLLGEYHPSAIRRGGVPTSMPLLSMILRGLARHLISKAPRIMVNTASPKDKSWVENQAISANKRLMRSEVEEELFEVVRQSMVGVGVMFMGPQFVGTPTGMKVNLKITAIDRADYFYDMRSTCLEEADIQGFDFDVPVVDIWENPDFDPEARVQVQQSGQRRQSIDEISNLSKENTRPEDLYDYARLRCVYEKRRNVLWYYPRFQPHLMLFQEGWKGPREGPFLYLYYEKIAGNALPIAPAMHLLKKHRALNALDIKAIHQAQAQKNILAYTNAGKEDAERVANAVNNQTSLQETGAVRMASFGGADQGTVAMKEMQQRDLSYISGNFDQWGGLASQAPTLGQERLLADTSSEMLKDMSGWAQRFMKKFCQNVFWYDLHDPDPSTQLIRKPIEGTDYSYQVPWTAEHRAYVAHLEYDVDVEPYSYVSRSPSERLADLLSALQMYQGLRADAMAQGMSLDVEAVIRTIADYKNLPELYDWLIMNQDPQRLQQLLGPRTETTPPDMNTPHTYIRKSESSGDGTEMEMMRMMNRSNTNQVAA